MSADRLADLLWQGSPPDNARANLQLSVHRLRRCLGTDRIFHRHGGYALVVADDELDATLFARLSHEGRHHEALALWRGTPYEGIDDLEPAQAEAVRLEGLRHHTVIARIDDDLADGKHSALVPELTALVDANPLDERLRGQLMLALHRAGRQVDALAAYQDGRRALVDELGLEPGAALRELHESILNDDPGLDLTTPAMEPPVPAEVPAPSATFTGRDEDVTRIAGLLTEPDRVPVVVLTGIGGVGKSALAMRTAHHLAAEFPDGQLYVNLQGATPGAEPLAPIDVLGRFLRSLGVEDAAVPSELDVAAARFRSLTAGRSLLVVLDDAADVAQVRPLLPGGTGSAVLVTSRQVLTDVDGAINLGLGALDTAESMTLVAHLCDGGRLAADPAAATELVALCGGLPLALCLAAARLARRPQWPVSALVERLRDSQRRLDELESGDRAVRTSFGVSHDDLSGPAARVFACISLIDVADVGVAAAAAAAHLSEASAEDLLEELVDCQLVESPAPGRFRMHDLIRLFARECAARELTAAQRAAVVRRTVRHYLATTYEVAVFQSPDNWRNDRAPKAIRRGGTPMRSDADVNVWLLAERGNLRDLAREIVESGPDGPALCAMFANLLFSPLNTRGQWYEMRALNQLVLDVTSADDERLGESRALAHNDLGWAYAVLGRGEDAVAELTCALDHWRRTGHRAGEAHTRRALVKAYTHTGRSADAMHEAEHALTLFRSMGARTGEIDCLIALGLLHLHEDRVGDAIETHEKALATATEVDDEWHRGAVLGNLGELYRRDGRHALAREHFEDALLVDREVGNDGTYYEAEHLWGLGSTLHALGDAHAHACWDRSAWILRDLGLIGSDEYDAVVAAAVPDLPEVIAQQL